MIIITIDGVGMMRSRGEMGTFGCTYRVSNGMCSWDGGYCISSKEHDSGVENGTLDARQLISNAGLRTQTCGIGFLKLLVIVRDMTIIGKLRAST